MFMECVQNHYQHIHYNRRVVIYMMVKDVSTPFTFQSACSIIWKHLVTKDQRRCGSSMLFKYGTIPIM